LRVRLQQKIRHRTWFFIVALLVNYTDMSFAE
jgi:hypothetical protein